METSTCDKLLVLRSLHPREVVRYPQICDLFRVFLQRASPDECNKLLPEGWRAKIHAPEPSPAIHEQERREIDSRVAQSFECNEPPNGNSSEREGRLSRRETDSRVAQSSKCNEPPNGNSSERLCSRAVTKALGALKKEMPVLDCYKVWTERGDIFGNEDQSPCRRLDQGRVKLEWEGSINHCTNRCILLFVAHEIDARRREGRASAIDWYCNETGQTEEDVKSQLQRSAKYEQLLKRIGPGILLLLGEAVRDLWEKQMTNEDVEHFLEKLELDFPHIYDLALRLNQQGGEFILDGLRAYGSFDHFRCVETRLRIALWIHCRGLISLPWSQPGRDPRCSEDDVGEKKRYKRKRYGERALCPKEGLKGGRRIFAK